MATSPSPNSAPSAVRPPSRSSFSIPSTSPDHLSLTPTSSPPPESQYSRSRAKSPTTTKVPSMAPTTSPSANSASPSPGSPPPPSQQPEASPPPPSAESPHPTSPPPKDPPPVANSPPPVLPDPPKASPPPPSAPINSPPPPSQDPPATTPVTPSPNPPAASPHPPSSNPPSTSPPPRSNPPQVSPPPADRPPQDSLPSPSEPPRTPTSPPGSPPQGSAPSSGSPPTNSTTPPSTFTPPPPLSPGSQPSPNSSATPAIPVSPPPPGVSPPSPTQLNVPPSGIRTHNSHAPSSNVSTGVAVGIGIVLGFLLLGAIGVAAWCTSKRRKRVAGMPTSLSSSPNTDSSLLKAQRSPADTASRASEYVYSPSEAGGMGNSRPWFTYEALVDATNGFSEENLLGEGGFGRVYKGHLPDGQEVAVKQLKIGGGQGEREFKAEVEIISRIHHRHLVSLAGYCISESRRLLVYEYVPNNTLHFHLHGPDRPVMNWETRVKIAAGAARGIAYLHEDCLPRIIHRDIKSANILLDKNFEARVSDFGLAKLAADANSHVTTRVMGTFGYMAPEYAQSGKLTEKSDVFSFGVVLLELITGRRPVDTSQPLGEESLAEWARPKLSHALTTEEFGDLVDPRLEKNYVESEMFRVIEAAAACVRHSATKRPSMGQVVRAFENMMSADLSNGMRVGESAIYNSAEQSAEIRLFQRMAFGSQDYSTDLFSQGSWHNSG